MLTPEIGNIFISSLCWKCGTNFAINTKAELLRLEIENIFHYVGGREINLENSTKANFLRPETGNVFKLSL